jgi:AcrR family transcriptional regulator
MTHRWLLRAGTGCSAGSEGDVSVRTLQDLKEIEREARRDLILETARRLFSERDFRSVTVREIAARAGVSPGTIYRYYQNLDELFLEIFLAGAREITRRIDLNRQGKMGWSLARFCEIYVGYLNDNMTFYQMMGYFMLGGRLSADTTQKLNTTMRELMDRVEMVVNEAGIAGDTRLVSHALFSAMNGIMISYAQYPGRTLDEVRRHTLRLAAVVAGFFAGHTPSSS